MSPKQIKLYEKEIEKIRQEIDKMLISKKNEGSKYNWARIDRLVEVNVLLEQEQHANKKNRG